MSSILQRLLGTPMLSRIRRNHGLEHATIHLLSRQFPRTTLIGRADSAGFYLFGEVPTEAVEAATHEALERMRAGEHHLAIHPNCGTNLLTAGLLGAGASIASLSGSRNTRDRLERLPLAILATTLALILAQPLGTTVQQHLTTQGDPEQLEIVGVRRRVQGRTVHRVLTRG